MLCWNGISNDITSQIEKMQVPFESYTSIYKTGESIDIKNYPQNVYFFLTVYLMLRNMKMVFIYIDI